MPTQSTPLDIVAVSVVIAGLIFHIQRIKS
jgi:hypothetical protein